MAIRPLEQYAASEFRLFIKPVPAPGAGPVGKSFEKLCVAGSSPGGLIPVYKQAVFGIPQNVALTNAWGEQAQGNFARFSAIALA
jgi:hypothetical protein